jgi:hypothetical protein
MSVHSPLGASSAERWMACPGSIALLQTLAVPPSDESEYAAAGTAAHEAAAYCIKNGVEAWEVVDTTFNSVVVSAEMADAIQDYLDFLKPISETSDLQYCEYRISGDFHDQFYGTVDYAAVNIRQELLRIVDFKFGEGIAVEAEHNKQLLYYAYGMLLKHPGVSVIEMTIVQPRLPMGQPIRSWVTTAECLREWGDNVLKPAMLAAGMDGTLDPGDHCRFCPAKLVCPMLSGLHKAAADANVQDARLLSDEALGREYALRESVKMYLKAIDDEVFRRLSAGKPVPGTKLVNKKADRVFKEGAATRLTLELGGDDLYETKMKSPAQIEKLGPKAKALVAELAYTPDTGLTVAVASDKRPSVKVQTTDEAFGAAFGRLGLTGSSALP